MGTVFKAECPCGFKAEDLYVGCGMAGPEPYGIIVGCSKCGRLWDADRGKSQFLCSKCKSPAYFLHDPKNHTPSDIADKIGDACPYELEEMPTDDLDADPVDPPEFSYRCPRCGELTMKLEKWMCWD